MMATNESGLEIVIRARNEMKESLLDIKKQVDDLVKSLPTPPPLNIPVKVPGAKETVVQFKDMLEQANRSVSAVGNLASTVQTLGRAFVGLEIVRYISSLAQAAAHEEKLIEALHGVAAGAGISKFAVDEITKSMKEMGYTTEQATSAINRFIRADFPIDKMEALAKGARDLAVVAGTDAASALERLIFSIQNLTTRSMRMLGLNIDLTAVMRHYAAAHDTTVGAMDRHTKSVALLEEVQTQLNRQAEAAASTQGLLAREMTRFRVQTEEAKTAIGQGLMPIYRVFVEEGIALMKNLQAIGDEFHASGTGAKDFADSIRPIVETVRSIIEFIVKHIEVLGLLVIAYEAVKLSIWAVSGAITAFNAVLLANPVTAAI